VTATDRVKLVRDLYAAPGNRAIDKISQVEVYFGWDVE
jgi:hypothetical protein